MSAPQKDKRKVMRGWIDPESSKMRADVNELHRIYDDVFKERLSKAIRVCHTEDLVRVVKELIREYDAQSMRTTLDYTQRLSDLHKNCPKPDTEHEGEITIEWNESIPV